MRKGWLALLLALALLLSGALAEGALYDAFWIIPDSDTRALSQEELWRYSRETLRYIRNEILARAGYAFEAPKFYQYFNAKPWYHAGGYGTEYSLSQVAWNNISAVKQAEREMDALGTDNAGGVDIARIIAWQDQAGGFGSQRDYGNARGNGGGLTLAESDPAYQAPATPAPGRSTPLAQPRYGYTVDYIIPDSDQRELTEGELWAYSRETLRYIRNEILARHGYAFSLEKFASYFGGKAWYTPGGYSQAVLSRVEWNNISRIKRVEKEMDELGTDNAAYLDITLIREQQRTNTCPDWRQ